jgi:hypothetical protein
MDKETMSHYGWIIICVLILAVLLALATPFGNFIADGFKATAEGFFYTGDKALTNTLDTLGIAPTTDELQNKHKFYYYSSLALAVDDINADTIGENADVDKEHAVAGIYVEKGEKYAVLLKDNTETRSVAPQIDMTINLGGNKLTSIGKHIINCKGGNIVIDGRLEGSELYLNGKADQNTRLVQGYAESSITIIEGRYDVQSNSDTCYGLYILGGLNVTDTSITANNVKGQAIGIYSTSKNTGNKISNTTIRVNGVNDLSIGIGNKGNLQVEKCNFESTNTNADSYGILNYTEGYIYDCNIKVSNDKGCAVGVSSSGDMYVNNCDIFADVKDSKSYGIINAHKATISNSKVVAYSNHIGDNIASQGIQSHQNTILTVKNCYAFGTHAGLQSSGTTIIDGGTYEGVGHGGFYFSGNGSQHRISNLTTREVKMPEGYISTTDRNHAGFYVGGTIGKNITVYMDNCDVYGVYSPFVLRGTDGEQGISVYSSNSRINTTAKIRIDNSTHKLYIGQGNNFTASNTTNPAYTITTNDVYN